MSASVRAEAPAKINLRLLVLARETTGYHSLESLFCAVSLHDVITVSRAGPGLLLEVEGGIDMGPADSNLVVRAARRFYAEIDRPPAAVLRVAKRIPAAAGLGGGSSDAAATLRALNVLHGEPLDDARLLACGADLGSDVSFFLTPTPYALGWGRGQRLLSLPPLPPRPVLIARPEVDMPTPALFRRLAELRDGSPPAGGERITLEQITTWERLPEIARNDFEAVAPEWIPDFGAARETLARVARVALLAGSGSSIFGIFDEPDRLGPAREALREIGFETWEATTLQRWPTPAAQD
jgi:4-diphosphocytidyl-2-C-methyl-D-erythritol kinase